MREQWSWGIQCWITRISCASNCSEELPGGKMIWKLSPESGSKISGRAAILLGGRARAGRARVWWGKPDGNTVRRDHRPCPSRNGATEGKKPDTNRVGIEGASLCLNIGRRRQSDRRSFSEGASSNGVLSHTERQLLRDGTSLSSGCPSTRVERVPRPIGTDGGSMFVAPDGI
jgi:hypothetical protein